MINTIFLSLLFSCFSNITFSMDELERPIQKEDIVVKFLDIFESTQALPDFDDEKNIYATKITTENTFALTTELREGSFIGIWSHLLRLDWLTTLRLPRAGLTNTNEEDHFEGIEVLSRLTTLDLSYNLLRNLPPSISRLRYLESLILNDNQFLVLDIKSESLKELNVSNNILSEIHLNTPRLTHLNISGNTTFTLSEVFFKELTQLTLLNLSNLYCGVIPESIGLLVHLTDLDISLNCLSCLPESLTKLLKLARLNACRNNLMSVAGLENLHSLLRLDLSYVGIQTAPALPFSCQYINLSNTQISHNPYPLTVILAYANTPLWNILHPTYYDDYSSDEDGSSNSESSEYGSNDEDKDDQL